MRLYISGPMTGYYNDNRDAFAAVAAILRARGHFVISPHELDFHPNEPQSDRHTYLGLLARDTAMILTCALDGMVLLEGWQRSKGSRHEVMGALLAELQLFEYVEGGTLVPLFLDHIPVRDMNLPVGGEQ